MDTHGDGTGKGAPATARQRPDTVPCASRQPPRRPL